MFRRKTLMSTIGALTAAITAGCGGGDTASTGTLTVGVTDGPVDSAEHVYVQFSGVEIHGDGRTQTFNFQSPKQIDLLALQGNNSVPLLNGETLDAGNYEWIRLAVDAVQDGTMDSYIVVNGAQYELDIPSGSETGLKLVQGFTVPHGGSADFTIDFDLRQSVNNAPTSQNTSAGEYILKPTLRMVDNTEVGHISGMVDGTLMSDNSCTVDNAAVYVFSGSGASFDDTGSANPPLTSSLVAYALSAYSYEVGFLEAGDYTVALTCEADVDDPATDDPISSVMEADVTVTAEQTSVHNFQ